MTEKKAGRFVLGHKKIGGFVVGSRHSAHAKALVSDSLRGVFGEMARRWKGESAGYSAKHIWIREHYGKASYCSNNPEHTAKRFEWANISGEYLRDISDYKPLCPSCHRRFDMKNLCRRGHLFSEENTYLRKCGWRECRICKREGRSRWK